MARNPVDERPRRPRGIKDRKRWCRGKEGVPHELEITREGIWGWLKDRPCREAQHWQRKHGATWVCFHHERCVNCGKILRPFLPPEECPDNRGTP